MLCYTHGWTQGARSFAALWVHSASQMRASMHTHSSGQTGPVTLTRHTLCAAYAPPSTQGEKRSPQGAGMQGLLDLLAATGVLLQDLAEVLLFLPLEDAQEVVELGHAEGIPLQGGGWQRLQQAWPNQQASPEKTRASWSHLRLSDQVLA